MVSNVWYMVVNTWNIWYSNHDIWYKYIIYGSNWLKSMLKLKVVGGESSKR